MARYAGIEDTIRQILQKMTTVQNAFVLEDAVIFDLTSLAWPLVIGGVIRNPTLNELCKAVGVDPRGFDTIRCDARRALDVCHHLSRLVYLGASMDLLALRADKLEIVETIVGRLHQGRREYGTWRVAGDRRGYPGEALHEVMDALNYCAAELVRMHEPSEGR